jgi:DNA polymerase-3 subunit epsilon
MSYAVGFLVVALVACFLAARRRKGPARANAPEPRSDDDNKRPLWPYVDSAPKRLWDEKAVAVAPNQRARDRRAAIEFVRSIMADKSRYVILDTETTGLGKTDEIVQLAVIDLDGNVLFNENIKPTKRKRMSQEAVAIHGLTIKTLSQCPTFAELAEPLERAIGGKTVIAYNALFDGRMYAQTLKLAGGFLHRGDWADIMDEYAKYVGEWDDYHQDYRWQRLPGGTHSALGDCRATLELLRMMAATDS